MQRILGAGIGLAVLLGLVVPASAQRVHPTGFQSGGLMVRLRADGVLPENLSSNVGTIGGYVEASDTVIPKIDLTYFMTPNISVEAIAGISRHNV